MNSDAQIDYELAQQAHDFAQQVVEDGIALLDERHPDWRKADIRLELLEQADCKWCVLGQVFGNYEEGLRTLDVDEARAWEFGFEADPHESFGYRDLDNSWREALQ